ncbi:hypothetical protein REPUB_Repub17cG0126400 [Reevesia pubescens]
MVMIDDDSHQQSVTTVQWSSGGIGQKSSESSSTPNIDPRSDTADLHGLALISISATATQIQNTLDRILDLLKQVKDPLGKRRLWVCQSDYKTSLGKFNDSFSSTSRNAYWDHSYLIRSYPPRTTNWFM